MSIYPNPSLVHQCTPVESGTAGIGRAAWAEWVWAAMIGQPCTVWAMGSVFSADPFTAMTMGVLSTAPNGYTGLPFRTAVFDYCRHYTPCTFGVRGVRVRFVWDSAPYTPEHGV